MPLYQRPGSPIWYYDFTIDGQRFRGSTRQTGKREAAKVEDAHREAARRVRKERGDWTMKRLTQAFYDEHAQYRAAKDTTYYQLANLRRLIGGERKLMSITNASLLDYRASRRGEKVTDASVNREIAVLRAAMGYVSNVHHAPVPKLAWGNLKRPEPPGRTRFLTFAEFDLLLLKAHESLRPILIAAVTTGLRKSNILNLDWSAVKLDARVIQASIKGNKRHTVRIVPQLVAALSTAKDRSGPVFDKTNFEKRWRSAVKAAKLEDLKFHDLRHTFASWARQSGSDIADVCEALGHSDISMTMRYAHIKPDAADTAFDRVSGSLSAHFQAQNQKGVA